MGIRNKNGQPVLIFNCVQCNAKNKTDFRTYPICKKCNKVNERLAKRNKNGHSEENNIEKKKKRGRKATAYAKYKDLCHRVADLKLKEGLSNREIGEIFNSEGLKTPKGSDWGVHTIEWLYCLYKKNNETVDK